MSTFASDSLADAYEAMVDWPRRLAHEEPFYRELIAQVGARRILDAACGTGHHAAMLESWGMSVEGADLSPVMIERAKRSHGDRVKWVVRGFTEAADSGDAFDLAICVGNSLALAPDRATAGQGVVRLLEAIRPGGAVLIHVLNVWRLPDGPCVWQKSRRVRLATGETLIHKGVHRSGDRGFVEILLTPLDDPAAMRAESASFLGMEATWLESQAIRGGAQSCIVYGGYRGEPYRREKSVDLVVVAHK